MSQQANYINAAHPASHSDVPTALQVNGFYSLPPRSKSPNTFALGPHPSDAADADFAAEEDPKLMTFKALYARSESRISALFDPEHDGTTEVLGRPGGQIQGAKPMEEERDPVIISAPKPTRKINEDDYDDSDSEEEGEHTANISPLKAKSTGAPIVPRVLSPVKPATAPISPAPTARQGSSSQWQGKSSDDVRKRLEEDKKAAENAARKSFHTLFYSLENDRDAMLEQQKLEESDRQINVELSGAGSGTPNANFPTASTSQQGSLSQANLGASSLTLKHLIARVDAYRSLVESSDQELRTLIQDARKGRSKWASEEKVGQEELYEATEKVLSELKAMTEHSQVFLNKVNKREAPDYFNVIKHPMDFSTMTKKLRGVQYKSKKEFVDDLNLIWANALKYNQDPKHLVRQHAIFMRKETEKLVPLIPDITIRDRAEVEADERRQHHADGDIDGVEDSDDEPIISSRGRKAPGKTAKKGGNSRKAPAGATEGTPGVETKPTLNASSMSLVRNDLLRADSDAGVEGSQNGLSTPPPGTITPAGANGVAGTGPPGSQSDPMDIDGLPTNSNDIDSAHFLRAYTKADHEDLEYKTWKQVTKKARAQVAAERHRLFKGDHVNLEQPALLRSKAGMRRWVRMQKQADVEGVLGKRKRDSTAVDGDEPATGGETLAEGMEGVEEQILPDYYDTMNAIPELPRHLEWVEDTDGHVVPASEESLHLFPRGLFTSPGGLLRQKMDSNMQQMQATRKVCTKIGIARQMQIQNQFYNNQFQKYDPQPFIEQDVEPQAVSDEDSIVAPWVCRAAMQRSIGEIFYHAGFEEFQPSALEAMTDIASEFFDKLIYTLGDYATAPKVLSEATAGIHRSQPQWKSKYTNEEVILRSLSENGVDVESLENYVKDEIERTGAKLGTIHERMKAGLADLFRPALKEASQDGANAFNDDSEQFVGGDFATELGEDYFGLRALGLEREFDLDTLGVPLGILQNKMFIAHQQQNATQSLTLPSALPTPPPYPAITIENVKEQIGLVQNFFMAKLHANNDEPLVEDEDLPQKQRLPKPRLPPTGKISSPRKKPVREPGPGKGHPRKKMKLGGEMGEDGAGKDTSPAAKEKEKEGITGKAVKPVGKLKLGAVPVMERSDSRDGEGRESQKEKDGPQKLAKGLENGHNSANGGMISPESLSASG